MTAKSNASNVLVILGHGSNTSFSAAVADTYAKAAQAAGHTVRVLRLADLQFDALLHGSNPHHQALEPDLLAAQEDIAWAQHIAWVFPVWWGGVPALLKGFLDRAFTSGWAYKFNKGSSFPVPLLKGRTAHLLVPMEYTALVLPLGVPHARHPPDAQDYAGVLWHSPDQDFDAGADHPLHGRPARRLVAEGWGYGGGALVVCVGSTRLGAISPR